MGKGYTEIEELLIAYGADISAKNTNDLLNTLKKARFQEFEPNFEEKIK